ncbi:hypothetical protein [Streptomyces sp. NPDC047985]
MTPLPQPENLPVHQGNTPPQDQVRNMASSEDLAPIEEETE